ncbi:unnamed protein product [Discula destructiva]
MEGDFFTQQTQHFLDWFKSQPGTTFHNDIEIQDLRHKGAGRGVIATAEIPADTVLFTIPRATILSKETSPLATLVPQIFSPPINTKNNASSDHSMNGASSSPVPSLIDLDDETAHDSWTLLILILIHAHLQGPASKWAPYLSILPQSPADFNTPMFWTPTETAELQASPVVEKIGRAEAEAMIRTKILPVIRAHPDVFFPPGGTVSTTPPTDDDLLQLAFRMGSLIMAYAFDLEPSGSPSPSPSAAANGDEDGDGDDGWVEDQPTAPSPLGMVPLADLLNADADFNAHIEHTPHALTATTLRAIPAGAEILNYYGPLGTGELLRRYGYVTAACARWDLVELDWRGHVLPAVRAELLAQGLVSEEDWERVAPGLLDDDEDGEMEEESFVLEYPATDPDSEGRVAPVTGPADVPEDLTAQIKALLARLKTAHPSSVPNKVARDRVIYGAVGRAVTARAGEYGTTLDEDEAAMEGAAADWSERKKMAMAVRMGEKKVLREVAQSVARRLAVLSLAERDGDGRSAKRRRVA